MSKDCEVKVIDLVVKENHDFSEDKFDMLSEATIQIFDLQKAEYLSSFYWVRVQHDLNNRIHLQNKGILAKLLDVEIDKKTRGPLLIKLCFDTRSLPVIAADAVISTVQLPMIEA